MRKTAYTIAAVLLAALVAYFQDGNIGDFGPKTTSSSSTGTGAGYSSSSSNGTALLAAAFENQTNDLWVESIGRIKAVLRDDNSGSRHQRLLIEMGEGQTILIAHNIDLAPRVANPKVGDWIKFRGEYEWNPKGGVIHWTHKDPSGRKSPGWLEYAGERYW